LVRTRAVAIGVSSSTGLNTLAYSTTGKPGTWILDGDGDGTFTPTTGETSDIVWNGIRFVAGGYVSTAQTNLTNAIGYSNDGIIWEEPPIAFGSNLFSVAFLSAGFNNEGPHRIVYPSKLVWVT